MNLVKRNLIIGVVTSFGVLGASGVSALDWSEGPQIIGTVVGGGIGGALGSVSSNPFVAGAAGAAGGIVGGKVGPYVAENPKKSAEIYSIALSGPIGIISAGYKAGTNAAFNFMKSLFS
jgi:predicted Abi (CAAX) family protease